MRKNLFFPLGSVTLIAILLASCVKNIPQNNCSQDDLVATVTTFASGLNNPRGLGIGPDGHLYVAEGGVGGTDSTTGLCDQIGYKGSTNGARIVRIGSGGNVAAVAENLPSSSSDFGDVLGVADVAFVGHNLYGLVAGAGCTHGVSSVPNSIVKVHSDKTWDVFANLSEYLAGHLVANPPVDFEPDGTWYSLISVGDDLYALEPNHGELV